MTTDHVEEALQLCKQARTSGSESQLFAFQAVQKANAAIDEAPDVDTLLAIAEQPLLQELERRISLRAYMEAVARSERARDRASLETIARTARAAGFHEAADLADASLRHLA